MDSVGMMGRAASRAVVAVMLALVLAGCEARNVYRRGEREAARGEWDRAVLSYAKASTLKPQRTQYQIELAKAKQKAAFIHFERGKRYLEAKQLEGAIAEFQQTTVLQPTNEHAQVELEKALIEWRKRRENVEKTELELAKEKAKVDRGVPKLSPASNIPIILKFKDTEIGQIYDALSKASGINFLYDGKLDLKKKTSIDLTNVTFEDAMSTLMLINKHFFKVVDENTILLADDTQQKRREIEDEVIKTFFLSNADVKDVQTLLRTLLDARKLVQNNQLNAITMRDTPNRVAIAEKIIESNDKSKAELIIEVELMEISRTVSQTLGINLSSQRYTVNFTGPSTLPLNNLNLLKQAGNWALGPIPSVTLDFLKSDSGTKVIVNPQLRVTEGEKANLHIGDSVPIPTTTFNTTGTVGTSIVPLTSFTYQEVGIVIEIEPRVHHNKEVTLKLNVEVSQLGEQVNTGQGQTAPAINSRQIATVIRLKDGETNLLAGLIRDDGSEGRTGFPGVIDVPVLRRIFSSQTTTHRETDLILTLTPHIIRVPDIREEDLAALFIGTESNPHLRGKATSAFGPSPFTPTGGEEAEEEETEEETAEGGVPGAAGAAQPAAQQPSPKPEAAKPAAPPAPAAVAPAPTAPPAPKPARALGRRPVTEEEEVPVVEAEEEEGPVETPGAPAPAQAPPAQAPAQPAGAPAAAPSAIGVALAPGRLTVAGGGGFAFNLMVMGAQGLQKISLTLKFDAAVAEFDQGLEGVFMRADGTQTSFSAQKTAPGTLVVEVQRLGGDKGATGNGSIAALRFRPVAAGRTLINIASVVASDPQGRPIQVNPSGADVTVSP